MTITYLISADPALKRLDRGDTVRHGALVGHGPARHRVRAVQFLWIRHATPLQLLPLFRGEEFEHGRRVSVGTPSCQHFRRESL